MSLPHLHQGQTNGLFPSEFSITASKAFIISTMSVSCKVRLIRLRAVTLIKLLN